jgi:DNA-binding transcriptional LysR family regulator
MSLNLHLLRLFTTVAQTGSFSRAAEVLHISQPAMSKSVRDFELQVGCRLLDRGPQGVTPTREGKALARHAAVLFAAERAAEEELRAMRGLHQGALRIGASTTIATYMIPDYLGAFHSAHPNIELHIVNANTQAIAELMIGHEIDIALVEGVVDDRSLDSEPWRTDAMVLIAAPSHPIAMATEPLAPDALAREMLIVREEGSGSLQVVRDALQAWNIVPGRTLEVGGTEAIKQVVAAGVGVAIVSAATVKDQVELGRLKIVPMRDFSIERTLWQITKPGRIQSPATVAFARLITNGDTPQQ